MCICIYVYMHRQHTYVYTHTYTHRLEKEMATHCSILAWKIPWTEEPGALQFTGSQGVKHNQSDVAYIHRSEEEPKMFFSFLNAQPSLETL